MRAFNEFGYGGTSGWGTSPPIVVGTPSAPIWATATGGDTTATVTWWPMSDNGAPITGYLITPVIDGVAQNPQAIASVANTAVVTGLTNGTNYTFRIAAINRLGVGGATTTSPTTPHG